MLLSADCSSDSESRPRTPSSAAAPAEPAETATCVARFEVTRDTGLPLGNAAVVRSVETDATRMSPAGMVTKEPATVGAGETPRELLRMAPIAAAENFHAVLWQLRDPPAVREHGRTDSAIVVSRDYAGELTIVDLPRLASGRQTQRIGQLAPAGMALGGRAIVELLLASQIARSFWHMNALICLTAEDSRAGAYRAHFSAEHHYYTNEHVSPSYRFTLEVSAGGAIDAIGEWHE